MLIATATAATWFAGRLIPPLPSSLDDLPSWTNDHDAALAAIAMIRLPVLVALAWLFATTLAAFLAHAVGSVRGVRWAEAVLTPTQRRLLGVGVTVGLSLAQPVVASASPGGEPHTITMTVIDETTTVVGEAGAEPTTTSTSSPITTNPTTTSPSTTTNPTTANPTTTSTGTPTPTPTEVTRSEVDHTSTTGPVRTDAPPPSHGPDPRNDPAPPSESPSPVGEDARPTDQRPPGSRRTVEVMTVVAEVAEVAATSAALDTKTAHDQPRSQTWTIRPGDHLWRVAEETLRAEGIDPSEATTTAYVQALIETNRDVFVLAAEPDLVYPGQVFALPALPHP